MPGFNRNAFKQESLELYRDICRLLAQGERGSLRQLVTPAVFSDMKRQLKQREDGGWARVQWDLVRVGGQPLHAFPPLRRARRGGQAGRSPPGRAPLLAVGYAVVCRAESPLTE